MQEKFTLKIDTAFGPKLGKFTIPKFLVDKINKFIDETIKNPELLKKYDAGSYLAGQVHQEIELPKDFLKGDITNFFAQTTKAYIQLATNKTISKFNITGSWVVRSFEGNYNPTHWHDGHISAAGWLKIPESFGESFQKNKKDNLNGCIAFSHGTRQFLSDVIKNAVPEVGNMYIFPSYLMHHVYPFFGKGERRSISFNAKIDENIFNVYS